MVIAGSCNGQAQQVLIVVHCLDNSRQEQQELCIFLRCIARRQEIFAAVRGHRPVIMLAGAVHAGKGLFMQEADKSVTQCDLLHDLHRKLVVVGCNIGRVIDRGKLMLGRCDLIVLGLGIDPELPELPVKICHVFGDSRLDRTEVMVIHFLSLRRHGTKERAAAHHQILALLPELAVYEEIFLLRADGGAHTSHLLIAEELENAHGLLIERLHRTQQRYLLIKRLAGIGTEGSRNVQRTVLDECIGGRIPCRIASCFKCGTQTAGREGGGIRFTLDQLLAGEFHDHSAIGRRGNKAVMLLGSQTRFRLEPVGIMRCTQLERPVLHCRCNGICNRAVELGASVDGTLQALIDLFGKTRLHLSVIKYH